MSFLFENIITWELLFWFPTLMDLLLLVFTYGYCSYEGVSWYLNTQAETLTKQKEAMKKKNDNDKKTTTSSDKTTNTSATNSSDSNNTVAMDLSPEVHMVWELAMAAYTAYACLLPLSVYWCIVDKQFRVPFCWTMTLLMIMKTYTLSKSSASETINESKRKEGIQSLLYFYFPTYGGYAILKTFVL